MLERSRFVVVVGASGSGKSSLVGAGLLPRLRGNAIPGSKDWILPWYKDNKRWSGVRLTPGEVSDDPFAALAVKLGPLVGEVSRGLAETLSRKPQQMSRYVDHALSPNREWSQLVIFIDQFEELFTVAAASYRAAFIDLLSVLAQHERCRTIATIRSDFYHRCVENPTLSEFLEAGSFPLSTPLDTLSEMITKPAERAGLVLEEGLVGRILVDMAGQPGSLPLMAYTLDELYKAAADKGVICMEDYEDLGGVRGAIGRRAEEMYKDLGGDAREALPRVFRNLIAVDEAGNASRRRAPLADFANDAAALDFTELMTKARLLTATEKGEAVIHVAHEALFNAWERLSDWIRSEQEDLILLRQVRLAAALWANKGKSDSYLWSGERLKEARSMRKRRAPVLTNDESEFLRSEVDRLMQLISDPKASHRHRAEVGDRLALVGDTRPGVGLRPDGLPDLVWCKIEGLEGVNISKYLITFAQYRAFADTHDDSNKFRWEPNRPTANCPAEGMSFYEARTFCHWLGQKLGYEIRLPSETEWKLAARGNHTEYEYPWGTAWESLNANTAESRIVRTTAVGMYPGGASPCGALDMSGNVWEWTLPIEETKTIFLRGGSWLSGPEFARISSKRRQDPDRRGNLIGFRPVALNLEI